MRSIIRGIKRRLRAIYRAARPIPTGIEFEQMPLESKEEAVAGLAWDRARAVKRYRTVVESLRSNAAASKDDAQLYRRAVARIGVDELTHPDVVTIARLQRWQLIHGDSFFRRIVERRRLRQLGPIPEKYLGHKDADLRLAQELGIAVPETLWSGKLADVPANLRHGTFLKPTKSLDSRGAFHLFKKNDIFSVFSSQRVGSWEDMVAASLIQMAPENINEMTWEVQELITDGSSRPARDMKFYVFYGQIGLILEVSRHPRKEYAYFNEDGSSAPCGRNHVPHFLDPADTITDKGGLSEAMLETVRRFSLALPVPFMRIDFLTGDDKLVFCEFSSAPGMSHIFNRKYDQILGQMYNEATIRLTNDLLEGKTFDVFHAWSQKP